MTTATELTAADIVCPSWCRISGRDHADDLHDQEGCCFHWSHERSGDGWQLALQTHTLPDGTPVDAGRRLQVVSDDTAPRVNAAWVWLDTTQDDGLTLEQAETLARALLAAVEEARA